MFVIKENKQKSAVTEGLLHTGRQHALTVNNWNEVYTHNERGEVFHNNRQHCG